MTDLLTTYGLIEASAVRDPDADALVFLEDGTVDGGERRWTFGELYADITRAANMFHSLGVGRSDTVSLLLPNLPETQVALWGAEAVGIANPINSYLNVEQIIEILKAAQTKVLVAQGPSDPEVWEKVQQARRAVSSITTTIVIDDDADSDAVSWSLLMSEANAGRLECTRPSSSDIAAYFHTGGTTGTPKLALHTHANQVINAGDIAARCGVPGSNALILGTPLYHVAGVIVCSLGPLGAGKAIVMAGRLGFRNPRVLAGIWDIVEKYRADMIMCVPTVLSGLIELPVSADTARGLRALVGAAPVSAALSQRWRDKTGALPVVGYGLTEGTCLSTLTPFDSSIKPGTVGPALPGCEIRVVDKDADDPLAARVCVPGESGLVLLRGPNIFPGYKDAARNDGVLLEGGWLNTGDLGAVDEEGWLSITGRAKDLIKRSGHGIDPAGVEEVLASHEAVQFVAVVGRPDPYAGEVPIAYVQLRAGVEGFDTATALSWCKERVGDPAAAPIEIVVVDQMPTTTVGKTSKVELRRLAGRRAIENEVRTALRGPFVEYRLSLVEEGDAYVGALTVTGASQRALDFLRVRIEALSCLKSIAIDANPTTSTASL
ncbi:AMP-binding protein [Rhodococcus sp. NPDC127530]|uniref:AMP-binding protein n=1 Tax=unclassified Rhodococcus (in: high G+C Gram-positive bacteria) TaxID=192944 RepID=UPI00362EEC1C